MLIKYTFGSKSQTLRMRYSLQSTGRPFSHRDGWSFRIYMNSFSRSGTKIWNEMPLTLRNLSKHDFKRKIKRVLFNILSSEDSYLDIRNVIQKVKIFLRFLCIFRITSIVLIVILLYFGFYTYSF